MVFAVYKVRNKKRGYTYLLDYFELDGKIAVVTGGASGIGLATAKLLSQVGTRTIILDINQQKGKETEKNLRAEGLDIEFVKCDVTNSEECQRVAQLIEEKHGKVDVLFNNAGIIRRKTVVELDESDWDAVINVSLKGVYLLSKYLIPLMRHQGGGSIINTGSGWGLKGGDKAASYCAAKAGVVNLTKAMAIDHGAENIRVNCICPGDTDTPLLRGEAKQLNIEESSFLRSSAVDRPLARLGTPEDIAKGVLFLASGLSAWVTGTTLTVDGGGLA
ncbi:SDR family NAD(P)-dependent oxidoreductase [Lysinibacillus sp. 38-6]|uniref:SDR family NAD(P)-dependent oxidoreductase n=1 Tax=Lysinibacillus sp. 38-6 TaxID=3385991 RepID=UPI003908ADBC